MGSAIGSAMGSATGSGVGSATISGAGSATKSGAGSATRSGIGSATGSGVGPATGLAIGSAMGSPVRNATLVKPEVTPELTNRTKARFRTASSATNSPLPCIKVAKVSVESVNAVVNTNVSGVVGLMQSPVSELVSQSRMFTPGPPGPASAVTVMSPVAPTLLKAIENTPVPVTPGISAKPLFSTVATRVTRSGMFSSEELSRMVFIPESTAAVPPLRQENIGWISSLAKVPVMVKLMTKLCSAPTGRSTGVLGEPVKLLSTLLVVW